MPDPQNIHDLIAQIEAVLPTMQGEWLLDEHKGKWYLVDPDGNKAICTFAHAREDFKINSAFIAACSPHNVQRILDEMRRLREERKQFDALVTELRNQYELHLEINSDECSEFHRRVLPLVKEFQLNNPIPKSE